MTNIIAIFKRGGSWGGGPIYTKNLVENLQSKGFKTLLISDDQILLKKIKATKKIHLNLLKEAISRYKILAFIFFWPIELAKYFGLAIKLKKENCKILILQDLNEKMLMTFAARIFNIKVYWIEHIQQWEPYLIENPLFFLLKFNMKFVERIISPSEYLARQIKKITPKVIVINSGVPSQTIGRISAERLVVVTRLHREKGIDILIRAMKKVDKNIKLLVIGDGPDKNELKNLTAQLNLQDQIEFVGLKYKPFNYIGKKDILILPSLRENFPLILLEALSAGLPIIASNVGGNAEIVENGTNGYIFKPNNVNDLVEKINKILSDKKKLNEFRKNNLKKYAQCYQLEIMVQKTLDLLDI